MLVYEISSADVRRMGDAFVGLVRANLAAVRTRVIFKIEEMFDYIGVAEYADEAVVQNGESYTAFKHEPKRDGDLWLSFN